MVHKLKNTSSQQAASGFTLVELLIVIFIIALLIGLLMPTLGKAREASRKVACLSQLREIYRSLQLYGSDNRDQVPIGYRTVSKQFNSMIFTTTGSYWVEFGLLYRSGLLRERRLFYCPSENNTKFMFNTTDNPWPDQVAAIPSANIQAGYAMYPSIRIADDLISIPGSPDPFRMPRLNQFRHHAILADLTASYIRVATRHKTGINVCYGDGSAQWVPLTQFVQPAITWPDPINPPAATYNGTQDAIWSLLQ